MFTPFSRASVAAKVTMRGVMFAGVSRPDIAYALSQISAFSSNPGMCGYSNDGFRERPGCEALPGCGAGLAISSLYFVSFNVFISFIMLNLFIGVIIDGFAQTDDTQMDYSSEDFINFKERWARFDVEGDFMLLLPQFREFVKTLGAPWCHLPESATDQQLDAAIGKRRPTQRAN